MGHLLIHSFNDVMMSNAFGLCKVNAKLMLTANSDVAFDIR
jgi:hypothetical protein